MKKLMVLQSVSAVVATNVGRYRQAYFHRQKPIKLVATSSWCDRDNRPNSDNDA